MGVLAPTPKITPAEFPKIRARLLSRGFTSRDIDFVEKTASRYLTETTGGQPGIHRRELEKITRELKKKRGSDCDLSDEQIHILEDVLEEKL